MQKTEVRYELACVGGGKRPWQLIRIYPDGAQVVALKDMDEDEATVVLAEIEGALAVGVAA